jgi:hypothetical protein
MAIMPGEAVRIRAPRSLGLRRPLFLVNFAFLTFLTWAPSQRAEREMWQDVVWGFYLGVVVVLVGLTLLRPDGVDLRDDVAVVVGPLRAREVRWRDVQTITLDPWPRASSTFHLADGRKVAAGYPCQTLLLRRARVKADHHRVEHWWLTHRGPGWRPVLAPPPPYPAPEAWPVAAPRPVEEIWRTPPEAGG